jgi:hypothetical protein
MTSKAWFISDPAVADAPDYGGAGGDAGPARERQP